MADDVDHVFSSEIHPRKREFIEHNFASASSRGDMMRRDQPPRCDVYVCGFPLQTIFHIAPYCDGRSRSSRQALERLSENIRHLIDLWATSASTRLGRRQATHQMRGHGGGNHHPRCDIFWCRTDVVGEYDVGHRRGEDPGRSLASPQGPSRNHEPKSSTLRSVSLSCGPNARPWPSG